MIVLIAIIAIIATALIWKWTKVPPILPHCRQHKAFQRECKRCRDKVESTTR